MEVDIRSLSTFSVWHGFRCRDQQHAIDRIAFYDTVRNNKRPQNAAFYFFIAALNSPLQAFRRPCGAFTAALADKCILYLLLIFLCAGITSAFSKPLCVRRDLVVSSNGIASDAARCPRWLPGLQPHGRNAILWQRTHAQINITGALSNDTVYLHGLHH